MYMSSICVKINSWGIITFISNKVTRLCRTRFICNMYPVKDPDQLIPPVEVKGMTTIDRDKFSKPIVVPWLEIDEKVVGNVIQILKKYFLKLPRFKALCTTYELLEGEEILSGAEVNVATCKTKRVFLNPVLVGTVDDIEVNDRNALQKKNITLNLKFSKIVVTYDNWKLDEILKAILADESFGSFSIIGHIVHVNLRDVLLPYKTVIGQVLLDKVNGAKTVVNKTDIIDNTYRNFKMEVLCGSNNMITQAKSNGCVYEMNFASVYWNPRLSTEHERIVNKLNEGDVLYDVFSGIGPFAIPAAKKKCSVLANDLNPESYKWLNKNCELNKVKHLIRTFNKDGKEFIENDVKKDIKRRLTGGKKEKGHIHITMNLPALAVNFLPTFCGLLCDMDKSYVKSKVWPVVHVYCFVSGDNPEHLAREEVEKNLDCTLDDYLEEVAFVRNVAPNKDMMRVSFKLSHQILFRQKVEMEGSSDVEEPHLKKIRLSTEELKASE